MKAPTILKTPRPSGPWLTDADLRHDIALKIGCPGYYEGKLQDVEIHFSTEQVREYQKQHGGQMVVDRGLIRQLMDQYLAYVGVNNEVPFWVTHKDYPEKRFRVVINQSVRAPMMDHRHKLMHIPGPVRFIIFLATPKIEFVGGKR